MGWETIIIQLVAKLAERLLEDCLEKRQLTFEAARSVCETPRPGDRIRLKRAAKREFIREHGRAAWKEHKDEVHAQVWKALTTDEAADLVALAAGDND